MYYVKCADGVVECSIRKNAKQSRIVVGDKVSIEKNEYDKGKYIITNVFPRKNYIPRPYIANIDKLLMVVAPIPKPDFYLIDKLIVYCNLNNIEPILVINKIDISNEGFVEDIKKQYYFLKIFEVSAKNNDGIEVLKKYISNTFCVLTGQSAVGKSSLINALIPNKNLETQDLSVKIERGKHTTRVNELYIYDDLVICDTPGFSSLSLDIKYTELCGFYPEFSDYIGDCKFLDCSHIKEGKDCKIVSRVEVGEINKDRYSRYIDLYNNLKKEWDSKYD